SEIVKENKLLHDEAYKKFEEEKKLKKELIKNIQAEESSAIMTKSLTTKQVSLSIYKKCISLILIFTCNVI
ncbi:unnamed protein product, partial [Heterobilharzia americana]